MYIFGILFMYLCTCMCLGNFDLCLQHFIFKYFHHEQSMSQRNLKKCLPKKKKKKCLPVANFEQKTVLKCITVSVITQ